MEKEKEKEKENVEVNHQQQEVGVTLKTKTTKKKKKKSEQQENHQQEEGVTKTPTLTKKKKKSEERESNEKEEGVTTKTATKEKKMSEELGSSEKEEGVTTITKTPRKKKKKSEEHESSEREKGVTANTKTLTKENKKSEEHGSSEQEKGVTKTSKKEKEKSEEHGSSEQEKGVTANTKTPTKKKKKSEEHENSEKEEGVTANTKTPTKKKNNNNTAEEHESSELNFHSLVIALPAATATTTKVAAKKKIGNAAVENVEGGGSVSVKKKRKSKKKGMADETEKVEDRKMELNEESMEDLVKPKPDSKMTESCKEMGLEEKTIIRKKKKKKKRDENAMEVTNEFLVEGKMEVGLPTVTDGDNEASSEHTKKKKRDENAMEVSDEFLVEGKMEVCLPTATDGDNETSSEHTKKKKRDENAMEVTDEFLVEGKMGVCLPTTTDGDNEANSEHTKKKRCLSSVTVDMEQEELEEAMRELMGKVKPASAAQTEENDMEVDTEMKKRKRKRRTRKKHGSSECTKMDTKPLEDNLQDLSVKEKPETVQQAVEIHEEVKTGQKVMKQQLSSSENGDGNQSQLKSNLEMKVINNSGIAFLTSENHEKMSASKRKRMNRKKNKLIARNLLEKSNMDLPVEGGLKASLLADENHASAYDLSFKQPVEKSGVSSSELLREVKTTQIVLDLPKSVPIGALFPHVGTRRKSASAYDLSFKQPVEKSGVSSSELLREVKTTQIVLDLPKSDSMGALFPHVGTRRKLLILDLNGLLLDIVMVVPRGYKTEKKIGPKSVFKRPFCDDFLKFCFERFEVGVWTSRTKRNMDDVLDFIMADMKHKLLFCWDQSHCTMTGINTIDNRHKPLVCKELSKLWDKHEPSLPWEKGEYNESNTLLLDDSPYKALLNPPNTAIFPNSYSLVDRNDNAIGPEGDIRLYLEGVAAAEHVQKYVKQHPFGQPAISETSSSWGFYCRVFDHFKRQLD